MANINEQSTNSLMNGGAAKGLPNDGTGEDFPHHHHYNHHALNELTHNHRGDQPRSMARTLPRVPQGTVQQGTTMDQDN
jgi:hypothetical protein